MKTIVINSKPFGQCGADPIKILENSGYIYKFGIDRNLDKKLVHGIIAGTESYPADFIQQFPNLEIIARMGAGFDNVDLDFCKKQNIIVTYTPSAPTEAVAEHTMGLLLNLLRNIRISTDGILKGDWNRLNGKLVHELIIGILGVGRIGGKVASLLKAFDAIIYGCDLLPNKKLNFINWCSKKDLFAHCDLITVHVPLTKSNYHLVSSAELKDGRCSYLINTSRGPIVDENAVIDALKSGKLAGFAADVFEKEPYRGELCNFPNVILTPHVGGRTNESRLKMETGAAVDCTRVLSGIAPLNEVPKE